MGEWDPVAFNRALAFGGVAGLLAILIAYQVVRDEWGRRRLAVVLGGLALGAVVTLVTYALRARPVIVPALAGLPRAEAEAVLRQNRLAPRATERPDAHVMPGTVIPRSQQPGEGEEAMTGDTVTFTVAVPDPNATPVPSPTPTPVPTPVPISRLLPEPPTPTPTPVAGPYGRSYGYGPLPLAITQPVSGTRLACTGTPCTIQVRGTSHNVSDIADLRLLLWWRQDDMGHGWFLQPLGVSRVEPDGHWFGTLTLGNPTFTARPGARVALAVSLTDFRLAGHLTERGQVETVLEPQPPGVEVATAANLLLPPP